jgi:hypothetical protein
LPHGFPKIATRERAQAGHVYTFLVQRNEVEDGVEEHVAWRVRVVAQRSDGFESGVARTDHGQDGWGRVGGFGGGGPRGEVAQLAEGCKHVIELSKGGRAVGLDVDEEVEWEGWRCFPDASAIRAKIRMNLGE